MTSENSLSESSLQSAPAPEVVMYCTATCPFCLMADRLLASKSVAALSRIRVDIEPDRRGEMIERSGRTTVPQIFVGKVHVGGYDELSALDRAGRLDGLLQDGSV